MSRHKAYIAMQKTVALLPSQDGVKKSLDSEPIFGVVPLLRFGVTRLPQFQPAACAHQRQLAASKHASRRVAMGCPKTLHTVPSSKLTYI